LGQDRDCHHGPVAANRSRASLSAFFRWAIGEGLCDHNPVAGTNKEEESGPRERSLSDAETAAVWLVAPDNDYGRFSLAIVETWAATLARPMLARASPCSGFQWFSGCRLVS